MNPERRPFAAQGELVLRRWALLVGAIVLYAISAVLMWLEVPYWGVLVEWGLCTWLAFAFLLKRWPVRLHGMLHADDTGLTLDGRLLVARERIATAFMLSREDGVVRIVRRWTQFRLDVKVEDEETARRLLEALGLGVGQSIAIFHVFRGARAVYLASMALGSLAMGTIAALLGARLHIMTNPSLTRYLVWTAVMCAPALVNVGRFARLDVGSDGLLVRRLWWRRFISYGTMTGASLERGTIVLELTSGRPVRLTAHLAEGIHGSEALMARIEEARASFVRGEGVETAEALVAPGGRPVERWLREVRAIAKARDYREARMDVDRLWRLLLDSTTSPATRAGAAIAIPMDDASRMRLRIAADACAETRLRVALSRVAEGASDTELEEALAPLLESKG